MVKAGGSQCRKMVKEVATMTQWFDKEAEYEERFRAGKQIKNIWKYIPRTMRGNGIR